MQISHFVLPFHLIFDNNLQACHGNIVDYIVVLRPFTFNIM